MNLFLLGCSSAPIDDAAASRALADLAKRLPYFPDPDVRAWRSAGGHAVAACVTHSADRVGGTDYACFEDDRMAIFAGRPIQWVGDAECEGRATLDARHYLQAPQQWLEALDGRCAVARWDDSADRLEVYTDPQGCYPVFWAEVGDTRWVSNSPALLAGLRGAREVRRTALATFLGCDHSLDGEAWWEGVHRVPSGAVWRIHRGEHIDTHERLPLAEMAGLFGSGFDPQATARLLVAAVRACAAWPGRPSVVSVTGGRDSRTILAAALRAGLDFSAMTVAMPWAPGWPETDDVRRGRALSQRVGVPHERVIVGPQASVFEDPQASARTLALVAPLPLSQYDAMTLPSRLPPGPLEALHMGLGGELARAYFGLGDGLDAAGLTRRLLSIVMPRPPEPLLSADGRQLVAETVRGRVDRYLEAGVAAADVPDVFYYNNRMASWGGAVQGAHEYVQDTMSAMWSWRLLGQVWGTPGHARERNLFLRRVLPILSTELMSEPFQRDAWRVSGPGRRDHLRRAAGVAADELRLRRWPGRREPDGVGPMELFARHLQHVREHVAAHPQHPAWDVLDRRRVERHLRRSAALCDRRSRAYVWRLGTVFMGDIDV